MTAVPPTGALSTPAAAWHTIDWYTVHRTVRRLQARLVKAVQVQSLDVALPRSQQSV
jgi:hypothetical protein